VHWHQAESLGTATTSAAIREYKRPAERVEARAALPSLRAPRRPRIRRKTRPCARGKLRVCLDDFLMRPLHRRLDRHALDRLGAHVGDDVLGHHFGGFAIGGPGCSVPIACRSARLSPQYARGASLGGDSCHPKWPVQTQVRCGMAGGSNGHDHVADVRAPLNCLMGVDDSIEGIARGDRMP
jgi:hypothetical protein